MLSFPKTLTPDPDADRPSAVYQDAQWVYEGTEIAVVGARDVTLADAVNPSTIGRAGSSEPEAVLLSLSEIEADERLNWAIQAGTRFKSDDAELFYKVPWLVWQEYAAQPVKAWLPECDATGLARSLAAAEREFRFAKQAFDAAGLIRNFLIVLASRLGHSRRDVGGTLGLSAARVQQLSEDPPRELRADVEELVHLAALVARAIGERPCRRGEIPRPPELGGDQLDEVLDSMIAVGLLEEEAGELRLSGDGRVLLEVGTKAKSRKGKSPADRERVSHAAR